MINQVILFFRKMDYFTNNAGVEDSRRSINQFDSCNTGNSFTKGQVRYISILTNLRGFRKKKLLFYFSGVFFVSKSSGN